MNVCIPKYVIYYRDAGYKDPLFATRFENQKWGPTALTISP